MSESATRNGPGEWRDTQKPSTRIEFGRIRRMVIGVTSRVLWQMIGHIGLDGKRETRDAEVFGGAGIVARPGGRNAEAIVIFGGDGAGSPVVVAIRDEQMIAALRAATNLGAGETALGSGTDGTVAALLYLKADGTIEARTPSGSAVSLAKQASVEAFRMIFNAHVHPGVTAGAASTAATITPALAIEGTDVLKGE